MRYYKIVISDVSSGKIIRQYTSLTSSGFADPNALKVEFDLNTTVFSEPMGSSYLRIWGIPITDVQQTSNFNPSPGGQNYKQIQIYAGMSKGLPLAKPQQAGLICSGLIYQAFGNWQGTQMTLDLMVIYGGVSNATNANLILDWKAGTNLSSAIKIALSVGFPSYKVQINIKNDLVLSHDEQGYYGTLIQFAQFLRTLTQGSTNDPNYPGVRVSLKQSTFIVDDATTPTNPIGISFEDLIGQPTWLGINQISFNCALRGDVSVLDWVSLPVTLATTSAQSYSLYRQSSVFKGAFQVINIRHLGNSRDGSGLSWISNFIANIQPGKSTTQ